jgi:Xaa-Pro aminopeptidase
MTASRPLGSWLPAWDVDPATLLDADHPIASPVSEATLDRARRYRLARLREQLAAADCTAALLFDPVDIRYATDVVNMPIWMFHNASHYALVFTDGPVLDFAYKGSDIVARESPIVDEARVGTAFVYLYGGDVTARAGHWADEVAGLVHDLGGGSLRIAVDTVEPPGLDALRARGIETVEGRELIEQARLIKSPDEIELMLWSIRVCEAALLRMRGRSEPGRSELEIWAELHHENIRYGGEYIETRLLSSGPRTNPWYQEASNRVTAAGELLAVDCDMIGPYGYCADLSRTWTIGHTPFTIAQRDLYRLAVEQIEHNLAVMGPGVSYAAFNEKSWRIPERFVARNYGLAFHGVGLADEWPSIPTHPGYATGPFVPPSGSMAPGMTVCVESLMALDGEGESVKLETQVLITEDGVVRLDRLPWEDAG